MAQIIIHTYFVIVGSCYFVASHSKCNTIKQIEISICDTMSLFYLLAVLAVVMFFLLKVEAQTLA